MSSNNTIMLSGVSLKEGIHKIKVAAKDMFGNEGVREACFTVVKK